MNKGYGFYYEVYIDYIFNGKKHESIYFAYASTASEATDNCVSDFLKRYMLDISCITSATPEYLDMNILKKRVSEIQKEYFTNNL